MVSSPYLTTGGDLLDLGEGFALTATETEASPDMRVVILTEEMPIDTARMRVREHQIEERTALAERFAAQAAQAEGVTDVVLTDVDPLMVVVMAQDLDMQRDLQLHALFVGQLRDAPHQTGELVILVDGEDERPSGPSLSQ